MADQTTPKATNEERTLARKWAEAIESATNSVDLTTNPWSDRARAAARVILDTVPAPVPPTLADMTPGERAACRWMQADVENHSTRYVIVVPFDADAETGLTAAGEGITWVSPDRVTPRPDLPRMEWPGTEKPAPALPDGWRLADHPVYGRVMVTSPAPDRDGYLWGFRSDNTREGADRTRYKPDKLTYLDTGKGADQ